LGVPPPPPPAQAVSEPIRSRAVARGAQRPPRLLVMHGGPAGSRREPLAQGTRERQGEETGRRGAQSPAIQRRTSSILVGGRTPPTCGILAPSPGASDPASLRTRKLPSGSPGTTRTRPAARALGLLGGTPIRLVAAPAG